MNVKINITLKNGVLDPQAKTIFHALESLGFDCIKELKMTKTIELNIDSSDRNFVLEKAKEMSETLLVNTIIEDYTIELES